MDLTPAPYLRERELPEMGTVKKYKTGKRRGSFFLANRAPIFVLSPTLPFEGRFDKRTTPHYYNVQNF